jgi:hypothetical protein
MIHVQGLKLIFLQDKILQKISGITNKIFPRKLDIRKNNYPYLGVDTYFNVCNLQITKNSDFYKIGLLNTNCIDKLYINGDLISDFVTFLKLLNINIIDKLKFIIISESDQNQSIKQLEYLLKISEKIYASNLIDRHELIFPIPLGLEKQSFRNGSKMKDFKNSFEVEVKRRPINFIVAWNDETNLMRKKHREHFEGVNNALIINHRINARTLHKIMLKTLFVPSPAGNGFDCHRTWESLYLGCVPVILRSDYFGDSSWPVLVLEKWEDITSLSQQDLEDIYNYYKLNQRQSIDFSKSILKNLI